MGVQERATIIGQLVTELKAPVLAYVTGDRQNLQTQVSADVVVYFHRHLRQLGNQDEIVFLLYTRGGDANAAWPIINQIRQHCTKLTVAIPMFALSAGTLMTLGADSIVMGRYASLGPIDPTVGNQYNAIDPLTPGQRLPIAVEDVQAYLELAKQHDSEPEAFRRLSDQVHPLALGNVQRSINLIKALATRMLGLHVQPPKPEDAESLVQRLTTELYSHAHLIGRKEASSMGLDVVTPSDKVEDLLYDYWSQLVADLELQNPFDPAGLLRAAPAPAPAPAQVVQIPGQVAATPIVGMPGVMPGQVPGTQPPKTVRVRAERAYIETDSTCDVFVTEGEVREQIAQVQMAPGLPMQIAPGAGTVVAFEIHSDRWHAVR